ncbi:MAG: DUF11 domain-containing protein, partial [Gammaproteobacteria bacterium]|nr:DUF11 domain-containing protein [Gammaproteobacteria bacterium]
GEIIGSYSGQSPLFDTHVTQVDLAISDSGVVLTGWFKGNLLETVNGDVAAAIDAANTLLTQALVKLRQDLDNAQAAVEQIEAEIEVVLERLAASIGVAQKALDKAEADLTAVINSLQPLENAYNQTRQELINGLSTAEYLLNQGIEKVNKLDIPIRNLDSWYNNLSKIAKIGAWAGYKTARAALVLTKEGAELLLPALRRGVSTARNLLNRHTPSGQILNLRALQKIKQWQVDVARNELNRLKNALSNPGTDPVLDTLLWRKGNAIGFLQYLEDQLIQLQETLGYAADIRDYLIDHGLGNFLQIESLYFKLDMSNPMAPGWVSMHAEMVYMGQTRHFTFNFNLNDPAAGFAKLIYLLQQAPPPYLISGPPVDLELTMDRFAVEPLAVDEPITFQLTLKNKGPSDATGVVVTTQLPDSYEPPLAYDLNARFDLTTRQLSWTVGEIGMGDSRQMTFSTRLLDNGDSLVTAEVTAADQNDSDSTPANQDSQEDDFASTEPLVAEVIDLEVMQTVSPPNAAIGESVFFNVTVENKGPDDATGVVLVNQLSASYQYLSDTAGGAYHANTGEWDIGSLSSGSSHMLIIKVEILDSTDLRMVAEITEADQHDMDSIPANHAPEEDDWDDATPAIDALIDLELSKRVAASNPRVGGQVVFLLTVRNQGPSDATGVVVADNLPSGYNFVLATAGGSYDSGLVTWNLGSLAVGQVRSLLVFARLNDAGDYLNEAEVKAADQPDRDSVPWDQQGDDYATAQVEPENRIDLELSKTVTPATGLTIGDTVVFTLELDNTGGNVGLASGVQVTDILPASYQLLGERPSVGSYNRTSGIWTVGRLTRGSNATLVMMASILDAEQLSNVAEVSHADQVDIDSRPADGRGDDYAEATPELRQQIDLELTTTVFPPTGNHIGDIVTFTVGVENKGPDTATRVVVSDQLPVGYRLSHAVPFSGSYNPNNGQWAIGSLTSGSNTTLVINAEIIDTSDLQFKAEVSAANQFDVDSTPADGKGDDYASATPELSATIDLEMQKSVLNSQVSVGDWAWFILKVHNTSDNEASNIQVKEQLPSGYRFIVALPGQSYHPETGIWSAGTLGAGGVKSLVIAAEVLADGELLNCAYVEAVDQPDIDSNAGSEFNHLRDDPNHLDGNPVDDDEACIEVSSEG